MKKLYNYLRQINNKIKNRYNFLIIIIMIINNKTKNLYQ